MASDLLIRALRGNAKSVHLSSRHLRNLPKAVGQLACTVGLRLNNNSLSSLPEQLQSLRQLTELNLGNNVFEEIPAVLKNLTTLKKLYLFGNDILSLNPEVLGLPNLTVLNLNHNRIRVIPPAIKRLSNLEIFSVTHNQLEEIPAELGLLTKLTEINLANNKLTQIPQQLYDLTQLRKLCLARNSLKDLPEGILGWENLKTLDVAGNHLSMFPADFQFLALEELLFEGNNFVQFELFESFRVQEVFSLKELAARLILKEGMNKLSVLSRALPLYPDLQTMLSRWGRCALCFQRFLTTWLECVQFINLRKCYWVVFGRSHGLWRACSVREAADTSAAQVVASGRRVFLEHAVPVASCLPRPNICLTQGHEEHPSGMCLSGLIMSPSLSLSLSLFFYLYHYLFLFFSVYSISYLRYRIYLNHSLSLFLSLSFVLSPQQGINHKLII
ncbi:leucine-rich repeat-containing protein 69 isoform X2 [Astyanax mexicanus]|uniref:leucine-rich repeat-containing protein 69 isoform X2 n=1 Tax=Astyanax mexicanus TaxID=7994 RepID=UPI0020CB4777|nr:leucine-rich repeat-containing protein 69 isoform X2 [Astyanax mexicanus]